MLHLSDYKVNTKHEILDSLRRSFTGKSISCLEEETSEQDQREERQTIGSIAGSYKDEEEGNSGKEKKETK